VGERGSTDDVIIVIGARYCSACRPETPLIQRATRSFIGCLIHCGGVHMAFREGTINAEDALDPNDSPAHLACQHESDTLLVVGSLVCVAVVRLRVSVGYHSRGGLVSRTSLMKNG